MAVAIEDLPPLMWHAELGRSLPDVWTGTQHRGVQLHDLRDAVLVWAGRYGQRAWLRQLDPPVTGEMEDAVLRTIARLDGTPFPSTARLASRWLGGRVPALRAAASRTATSLAAASRTAASRTATSRTATSLAADGQEQAATDLETAYCAQLLAATYQAMGLLPAGRRPGWYDPGSFWSGDNLGLAAGFRLGGEISVVTETGTAPSAG